MSMGMVELLLVRSVVGALRNGRIFLASGVGVQRAACGLELERKKQLTM